MLSPGVPVEDCDSRRGRTCPPDYWDSPAVVWRRSQSSCRKYVPDPVMCCAGCVTLGPVTRWWPAPTSCWRVLRAPVPYRADRARARPTATATEKTATANRAQIPQSTSRGPMTAADMEVASYAPEIARSAQ